MTKKIKQIITLTGTTALTLGGAAFATVYGIYSQRNAASKELDNRTYKEKLWDQKVNNSNFVYNNLFFPINGEELSTKYLFLSEKKFDFANKQNIKKNNIDLAPLNKKEGFSISLDSLDDTNVSISLEEKISELNKNLVDFKKNHPNKNLSIDIGKDLTNRELFARIWELKDNVESSDQTLINEFMNQLEESRSSFRTDFSKKHFIRFFGSETYFSNEILDFISKKNVSASSKIDPSEVEYNFGNNFFGSEASRLFLSNAAKDNKYFKANSKYFSNSGFNYENNGMSFNYYFKHLIEKNIVITSKGFIDLKNQSVKIFLYFSKLDDFNENPKSGVNFSKVLQNTSPWDHYVKNPKWVTTKEFDITDIVKNVISKNNEDQKNLDLESFFAPEGNTVPSWRKMINNPIVQMGLVWSGNYAPTIDGYIRELLKLLKKMNFMSRTQISKVLNKKIKDKQTQNEISVQDKIIDELKKNTLVNYDDFVSLFNEKFDDDLEDFWTDLNVLSSITPDTRFKKGSNKTDYSDVYRVFSMVAAIKIVSDNLLPIIKEEFPDIYNQPENINSVFRKIWLLFTEEQIVNRGMSFNDFIGQINDPKGQVAILESIFKKGNKFTLPRDISKEIFQILPFLGINLSVDSQMRNNISNALGNYFEKEGSIKTLLVHLIGGDNKDNIKNVFIGDEQVNGIKVNNSLSQDEKLDDIKNKVKNLRRFKDKENIEIKNLQEYEDGSTSFDIEVDGQIVYYGTITKRLVNALFSNNHFDSELLDVISEIVYESRILKNEVAGSTYESLIIALFPNKNLKFNSKKDMKESFNKLFNDPESKSQLKNLIFGFLN